MPNNIKSLMQAQISETPTEASDSVNLSFDSSTAPNSDSVSESVLEAPEAIVVKTLPLTIVLNVSVPISYLAYIESETAAVRSYAEDLATGLGGKLVGLDIK